MTVLDRVEVLLSGDWTQLEKALSQASAAMEATGQRFQSVGKRLTIAFSAPLAAIGGLAVKTALDMDSLSRGLQVSAGSAKAAADQLKELEDIARLPGLGFKEAIQGAIQLNTVFSDMPDQIGTTNRSLREFGNAVALTGGGRAELSRVIFQLGQIAAAGHILTQDLRPIITTAPVVGRALKKAFGSVNAGDIEALGLTTEQFFNRLLAALADLPRAAAGPKNAFENLADSVERVRDAFGKTLLPIIAKVVDRFATFLESMSNLNLNTRATISSLVLLGAAFGPAVYGFGKMLSLMGLLATTGGQVAVIVGVLGATLIIFAKNMDVVALRATEAWTAVKVAVFDAVDFILGGLAKLPLVGGKIDELRQKFDDFATESLRKSNDKILELERHVNDVGAAMAAAVNPTLDLGDATETVTQKFDAMSLGGGALGSVLSIVGAAIDQAKEKMDSMAEAFERGRQITEQYQTPLERYGQTMQELYGLLQLGAFSGETFGRAMDDAINTLHEGSQAVNEFGQGVGDIAIQGVYAFANFAAGAGDAIHQFVQRAIVDLLALAAKIALIKTILSFAPGLGEFLGFGGFAGGFATGGTIPAGQWGIVGESGPEIVTGPATVAPAGGNAAAIAAEILARNPAPTPANPEAAAQSRYYRALFAELVAVGRHDGVRI